MVAHAFSTTLGGGAETEGSLQVQGQLDVHTQFQHSQAFIEILS